MTTSISSALRHLKKSDPVFAKVIQTIGACTWEPNLKRTPFEALVRAIAHQQLHGKAAETILARFIALTSNKKNSFPKPSDVLQLKREQLRSAGFSEAKTKAIFDIAQKAQSGFIPTAKQIEKLSDTEIIEKLLPLRGVGRWTIEMYLIFTLGRLDVLPVDDFGVREGFRIAYKKRVQPTPRDLGAYGARFAPFRTIASWYLWRIADKAKEKKK